MKMKTVAIGDQVQNGNTRWAAIFSRNAGAENAFFYGVKTTGVFCRPNCPSRLPRPDNVVCFDSAAEALKAGYRPCKRCQPDRQSYTSELDVRIARACRSLAEAEGSLPLKTLAKSVGMSPFHFHRLFRARVGITPKQFQASQRLTRFKHALRRNRSVTAAIYDAGFGSASRAYEQVARKLGMSPRQYRRGGSGVKIRFALQRTALGVVLIASTPKGVCEIDLGENATALRERLKHNFPHADLREEKSSVSPYMRRMLEYLAAPHQGLALPLDVRGTAFQQRVWTALQRIPVGETITYQDLARQIGAPTAIRAVAGACAANKLALAVPCHRVVRTDGGLGGYRWGLPRKRRLLDLEGRKKS